MKTAGDEAAANTLRLAGELTIHRAAELKEALLRAVDDPRPLRVDLSEVTDVDTAGVQLLILAQRAGQAAGRPVRLEQPSSAVAEVFALMNIGPVFCP